MRDRLWIAPAFAAEFNRMGLRSFGDVLRHFVGNDFVRGDKVYLKSAALSFPVFYKQYEYSAGSWRYFCRGSKARREYESYAAFAELGIASAERIACGEKRDALGRLRRAFIITRTIPQAQPLPHYLAVQRPRSLLVQLAAMTRRIHDGNFFHNDLYFRNILVTLEPDGPKLWWIDCPRGRFDYWSPWRRHKRIKDLATLDKSALQEHFSRTMRLRVLLEYLGQRRLDAEGKRLCAATVAYRRRRWADSRSG
jgi:hypothetical protein